MTTTLGHWRHLPTALGADDRLELDSALGSDVLQTITSNATHAARQNELGTLWEHPGSDVWETLLPGVTGPNAINWSGEDSAGVFVRYCGAWRLRRYGETDTWPTIELRARIVAPATYTTGIILVARRERGRPTNADPYDSATTTSTSLTDVSLSITPRLDLIGREDFACRPAGSTDIPVESGTLPLVHLYVGAWCTSDSGAAKGSFSGITVFLGPP